MALAVAVLTCTTACSAVDGQAQPVAPTAPTNSSDVPAVTPAPPAGAGTPGLPDPESSGAPVQEVVITYQDGTTVTWRGPASGPGWILVPEEVADLVPDPGQALTRRATAWDRTVREAVFGSGWGEELDAHPGGDGQLSFVRSTGIFASLAWASGPQRRDVDLDPCSSWPLSAAVEQSPEGGTCRVLHVDGHPVVAAEQDGVNAVFSVRPDGTAVFLEQRSVQGEPIQSSEELARAALTLPAP